MIRLVVPALLVATLALAGEAASQSAPDTENGRYTVNRVEGGWLRLDTRTGAVATCTGTPLACRAAPDERSALEAEIARVQGENAALKQELVKRGIPLPQGMAQAPAAQPKNDSTIQLPSDADIDRVMTFMEKVWKRMMDFIGTVTGPSGQPS
jgi:hypothetical protein